MLSKMGECIHYKASREVRYFTHYGTAMLEGAISFLPQKKCI